MWEQVLQRLHDVIQFSSQKINKADGDNATKPIRGRHVLRGSIVVVVFVADATAVCLNAVRVGIGMESTEFYSAAASPGCYTSTRSGIASNCCRPTEESIIGVR